MTKYDIVTAIEQELGRPGGAIPTTGLWRASRPTLAYILRVLRAREVVEGRPPTTSLGLTPPR